MGFISSIDEEKQLMKVSVKLTDVRNIAQISHRSVLYMAMNAVVDAALAFCGVACFKPSSKSFLILTMRRSARLNHAHRSVPRAALCTEPAPEQEITPYAEKREVKLEPSVSSMAIRTNAGLDEAPKSYRKRRKTNQAKPEPVQLPTVLLKEEQSLGDIEDGSHCFRPGAEEAREVTFSLRSHFWGSHGPRQHSSNSVLDALIATILSQATSGANSSRAFGSLKKKFPNWGLAQRAGPLAIADAIRAGGLADAKGPRIHAILKTVYASRGEYSLDYLRDEDDDFVKRQLCAFPGVGPKTASCVLLFAMGRAEFPVDTHVKRITARLGWMRSGASAEDTYTKLNKLLPGDVKHDLHVLLIEHGRAICKAQKPRCAECPIRLNCTYFSENEGVSS